MTSLYFQVAGTHCGGRASKVRQQVEHVSGMPSTEVNPAAGDLNVDGSQSLEAATVVAAVEKVGYEAVRT